MPSPRAPRCAYKEKGRRCRRNGTVRLQIAGQDPVWLCGAHRVVVEEAARAQQQPDWIGGGIMDALSEFLSGGRISKGTAQRVAADFWGVLGGLGSQAQRAAPGAPPFPFPWEQPPRAQHRQQQQPRPQVDPDELAARVTLGFGAREQLTVDAIKARKRDLALRHHPDRPGGSAQRMAAINDAADVLLAAMSAAV